MANYKNTNYAYITDKRTVPFNETATGTCSTNGERVDGVGTAFRSEMRAGSWLVDLANDEIRQVDRVESDTLAYLKQAFTSDLTIGAFEIIKATETQVVSISIQIPSGAAGNAEVDGSTFPKGTSMTFSKGDRDGNKSKDFVDPIIVDATGTAAQILIMK